jgi:hypothetical protein
MLKYHHAEGFDSCHEKHDYFEQRILAQWLLQDTQILTNRLFCLKTFRLAYGGADMCDFVLHFILLLASHHRLDRLSLPPALCPWIRMAALRNLLHLPSVLWYVTLLWVENRLLIFHVLVGFFLFLGVSIFGGEAYRRDWMMYPQYNYISWSYGLCVCSMFFHIFAAAAIYFVSRLKNSRIHHISPNEQ